MEGDGDESVFRNLILKINSPDASIYSRVCGGVERLMREFPALLRTFEYAHNGRPVDGALVIRDSDNKELARVFEKMREKLGGKVYPFPRGVELCVVKRKLDSWLLADENAINIVSGRRGGRQIARVNESIEDIERPKERLQRLLSDARLNYTSAVLGEIGAEIDIAQLAYRVRSFAAFSESVMRIYRQV